MKIAIAGGSGFIGKHLTQYLLHKGHQIVILSRNSKKSQASLAYVKWLEPGSNPAQTLKGVDVIINLAGVSINAGRWSKEHQRQIYESRMTATDALINIIEQLAVKPAVFINASAIGIYPASLTETYTETSQIFANDFLGKTVRDWEKKACKVSDKGIRSVMMRFGVVLGNGEGALPMMALPYKMYIGGKIGSGKQWVSWVHVIDIVRAIGFVIETEAINGPVNVTAPTPVQMDEFGRTLASVMHSWHWLPVPELAMKLALGKKSALVLEGQRVIPEVLKQAGFTFSFPTLRSALEDLV